MADYEAEQIGTLKDGREVYEASAPLGEQIKAFQEAGVQYPFLASPDDVALIRIEGISPNTSSRTRMMPIRAKNKPTILTHISEFITPIMAEVIMIYHRQRKYPDIFPESSYEFLENKARAQLGLAPEDRDVHILEGHADNEGKFYLTPEMPDTRFILRKNASKYFEMFKHSQVPFYDLPTNAPKNRAIANYLLFSAPKDSSLLYCKDGYLDSGSMAFGVKEKTCEVGSQTTKEVKAYTSKQIQEYSEILKGVRQGTLPASKLEMVIKFIDGLE